MTISPEIRPVVMRANRTLGASLVDHNLVKIEDLETANGRLLEVIAEGELSKATILGVLAYELKVLKEEEALEHLSVTQGIGLVDLRSTEIHDDLRKGFQAEPCWATWSIPFDKEEGFFSIASAYYLSPAVRSYWEKRLGTDKLLWFGTSLEQISSTLERLEAEQGASSR